MAKIHSKTAFSYIRRSPFQALAAIFVLALTFFVSTVIFTLVYSSNQILGYFETRPQVIAFLSAEAEQDQISELEQKLNQDFRVKDVKFVTKEEALGIYKEATVDNPLLAELVSPSIFPSSLEFSLADLSYAEEVISEIEKNSIVEQVAFTASIGGQDKVRDTVSQLRTLTRYVRIGGGVFVGILLSTSFLVLIVIISMRMATRKEEVEILNLIGATKSFIRKPIVIEAQVYAIAGVVLGWLFAFVLVLYTAPSVLSYFNQIPVLPKDTITLFKLFGIVLAFELFLGVLLAYIGSFIAVSRASRIK